MKEKTTTNIFVHLPDAKPADMAYLVADRIAGLAGVVGAAVNRKLRRLISVQYDPRETSGTEIISAVRRVGFNGSIVGL
ncbi:MAG: hypothetical protein LJE84_08585 [Gammaproteobacteria bacterium]|jgi:hypothetical protein|nr:hypothetical protein [Gammaproteobacteria bacterium]